MNINEYQTLASRTIDADRDNFELMMHALHGMVSEVGEIHGIYQKHYQGHKVDADHVKSELGDLCWFIAEMATAMNWTLEDVMQGNIDKLLKRYPEGFDSERSLHRSEGNI